MAGAYFDATATVVPAYTEAGAAAVAAAAYLGAYVCSPLQCHAAVPLSFWRVLVHVLLF